MKRAHLYDTEPECGKCGAELDEFYPFCWTCADNVTPIHDYDEQTEATA
jgi:predicted amidophosphoribosyltransferase